MAENEREKSITVDFDMAEEFLRVAKSSHQAGNQNGFAAAVKMIAVALGIKMAPSDDLQRAWVKR